MKSAHVVWLSLFLALALSLVSASANAATLSCPAATGAAGGPVTVEFILNNDGDGVVATQNDFGFDSTVLTLSSSGSSSPNCRINPAIGPATELDKLLSTGFLEANLARGLVISQTNTLPIPDGLLYSCTFQIAASAPRTATGISLGNFIASDGDGERLPATTSDCAVAVTDPPPTPTPPGFCRDDDDCPEGQICLDNRCVTPTPVGYCDDDDDCQPDEECIDNRCRPRPTATPTPTPPGFCRDDDDCPDDQVCIDNFCATPTPIGFCEDDDDCPPGQTCVDNRCSTATPTPIGFCNTDDDCPDDEVCIDNQCQPRKSGGGGCNCSIDPTAPEQAALNLLAALLPVGILLARRRGTPCAAARRA